MYKTNLFFFFSFIISFVLLNFSFCFFSFNCVFSFSFHFNVSFLSFLCSTTSTTSSRFLFRFSSSIKIVEINQFDHSCISTVSFTETSFNDTSITSWSISYFRRNFSKKFCYCFFIVQIFKNRSEEHTSELQSRGQ